MPIFVETPSHVCASQSPSAVRSWRHTCHHSTLGVLRSPPASPTPRLPLVPDVTLCGGCWGEIMIQPCSHIVPAGSSSVVSFSLLRTCSLSSPLPPSSLPSILMSLLIFSPLSPSLLPFYPRLFSPLHSLFHSPPFYVSPPN